jgi:hypothetical protein
MPVPQHPGRISQQQGLGDPAGNEQGNPYFVPNEALGSYTAKRSGAQAQQLAEAELIGARAGKAEAEASIMAGLGALGQQQPQSGPEVTPEQVQAEQIADGIVKGQIGNEQISGMVQSGEVSPQVADAAMGMAQQFMQADQARLQQTQGLGAF